MSDRAQRVLLWFLTLALVGGTVYALRFASGYRAAAGYAPISSAPLPPDVNLRLEQVQAVGRDKGRPAWTVTAKRIDTTRSRDKLQFSGKVTATILQNGKPRAVFSAPYAEFLTQAKRLRATNQALSAPLTLAPNGTLSPPMPSASPVLCLVHDQTNMTGKARYSDLRIETSEALWDVGAKTVECPGLVKATRAGTVLTGEKFKVNLETRDFETLRFSGEFAVEDGTSPEETLGSLRDLTRR